MKLINLILIVHLLTMLSACVADKEATVTQAIETEEPYMGHYKVGSPYTIKEKVYYPRKQPGYEEIGIASWYGSKKDKFHGKLTANGDRFDKRSLTAAHRSLPMPSAVRVTNLENGKSVIVMINDRGPFIKKRVIDVSERAAEILDMKRKGIARVKVQHLPEESKALLLAMGLREKEGARPKNPKAGYEFVEAQNFRTENQEELVSTTWEQLLPSDLEQTANKIFVKIGTYNEHSDAKQIANKFSGLGSIEIMQADKADTSSYHVQMGPFLNRGLAEQLLSHITSLGHKHATLIFEHDLIAKN